MDASRYEGEGSETSRASAENTGLVFALYDSNAEPQTRSRSGCVTCRKRKVKCDELKPICGNCTRLSRSCLYDDTRKRRKPARRKPTSAGTKSSDVIESLVSNVNPYGTTNAPVLNPSNYESVPEITDSFLQPFQSPPVVFPENEIIFDDYGMNLNQLYDVEQLFDPSIALEYPLQGFLGLPENPQGATFQFFQDHVMPPYLAAVDGASWIRVRLRVLEIGRRNVYVAAAIVALAELYRAKLYGNEVTLAMTKYNFARSSHREGLETGTEELDDLLIATFLLCCFEMIAPDETAPITLQPTGPFIKRFQTRTKPWSPISSRLVSWLVLYDGKAIHLGGRGLLSTAANLVLSQDFSLEPDPDTKDQLSVVDVICRELEHSAYCFHLEHQRFCRRIANLDRHHRTRDTKEDEDEVQQIGQQVAVELHNLWQRRPPSIDFTRKDVEGHLSAEIGDRLIKKTSVYASHYWMDFVYLDRAVNWTQPLSAESENALLRVHDLLDQEEDNESMVWPLFMYAIECHNPEGVEWAVKKLRKADNGITNCGVVAALAEKLAVAQAKKRRRLDSRYFSIEVFGHGPAPI